MGKRILATDGCHITVAFLLRDRQWAAAPLVMAPEDQRDKYMMMEELAAEMNRVGADAMIFTTEAWEAPAVDVTDPRYGQPARERKDRSEVLLTYAVERGGPSHVWSTPFAHGDPEIRFGSTAHTDEVEAVALLPVLDVWRTWR
jgi:hypothetical protein